MITICDIFLKSHDSTHYFNVQGESEYSAWILPSNGLAKKPERTGPIGTF